MYRPPLVEIQILARRQELGDPRVTLPEQGIQRGRHAEVIVDRLEEREVKDFLVNDGVELGIKCQEHDTGQVNRCYFSPLPRAGPRRTGGSNPS